MPLVTRKRQPREFLRRLEKILELKSYALFHLPMPFGMRSTGPSSWKPIEYDRIFSPKSILTRPQTYITQVRVHIVNFSMHRCIKHMKNLSMVFHASSSTFSLRCLFIKIVNIGAVLYIIVCSEIIHCFFYS